MGLLTTMSRFREKPAGDDVQVLGSTYWRRCPGVEEDLSRFQVRSVDRPVGNGV